MFKLSPPTLLWSSKPFDFVPFQPIRDRAFIWKSDKVSDAIFVTIIKWTQSIFNLINFEVPIFHVWRIPCNKKN